MNVGELRKLIEGVADAVPVVTPTVDHEYRDTDCTVDTALYDKKLRTYTEDHGEKVTPEKQWGKRITVLIVGE